MNIFRKELRGSNLQHGTQKNVSIAQKNVSIEDIDKQRLESILNVIRDTDFDKTDTRITNVGPVLTVMHKMLERYANSERTDATDMLRGMAYIMSELQERRKEAAGKVSTEIEDHIKRISDDINYALNSRK